MGVRLRDILMGELGSLRYEPTEKRIRGLLDGRAVVDSRRAMLVWEPSPLREAAPVTGRIAFFDERVDVVVDGERVPRPTTPWSRSRGPDS